MSGDNFGNHTLQTLLTTHAQDISHYPSKHMQVLRNATWPPCLTCLDLNLSNSLQADVWNPLWKLVNLGTFPILMYVVDSVPGRHISLPHISHSDFSQCLATEAAACHLFVHLDILYIWTDLESLEVIQLLHKKHTHTHLAFCLRVFKLIPAFLWGNGLIPCKDLSLVLV